MSALPNRFLQRFLASGIGLLCLFSSISFAQTSKVDSLLKRLKTPLADTVRLRDLKKLSAAYSAVDPKKKFQYAQIYKALAEKLNDQQAVADAWSDMGVSYGIRAMNDSSLYCFKQAYQQSEKVNYTLGMGKSLSNIGFVYARTDNTKLAIQNYFRALTIFKKMDHKRGISQCYTNIGSIYYDLQQPKLALSYFDEVLKIATETHDEVNIGYALFTTGNCYLALDQLQIALERFQKSLLIRERLGDLAGIAVVRRSMGELFIRQKQYSKAFESLNIALSYLKQLDDKYTEAAVFSQLARAYIATGQYEEGEQAALQAREISLSINAKQMAAQALRSVVEVYKKTNNLEKAFQYLSEYTSIKDTLLAEQMLKDVTLTELSRIKNENRTLENDNRMIQSKNTVYRVKVDWYSKVILASGLILIFVIVLTLVLYRRNREKQISNRLLTGQKEEIASINRELETLNEELTVQMEVSNTQNIELERLNNLKAKFFAIVSHDLRSPLGTLKSLFGIYRSGGLDDDELAALLGRLEDTILTTSEFLDNLLEWSKSQMDGISVHLADFDISESVANNIHLLETQAALKGLHVVNNASRSLLVFADQNMIDLVIRNLFSNSIKFCSPGDTITLTTSRTADRVMFSIHDTGKGISVSDQEKLFSLEYGLSSGTQGEKGSGLGLVLCRDMLLQNQGNIWFEPGQEKGSTFLFDLPASERTAVDLLLQGKQVF